MGAGFSQCFNPSPNRNPPEVIFTETEPLDETLGHSFCYVRSSARFLSPTQSDRFISPTNSLRFSPTRSVETGFKAISGASVSANTATPRTFDDATDGVKSSIVNGFESTSSFTSLPLQPLPKTEGQDRAFFMSGPIERGALSGPLDNNHNSGGNDNGRVPFSAPLGGMYVKKKKKGIGGIRNAFRFQRNFSEKNRPWVFPVRKDVNTPDESDVQWALGKAGEDRVHVVVSEEHGWLFVGIYDGFNGPDAPEFLMGNLYKAVYKELEGLFWDSEDICNEGSVKKVTFQPEQIPIRRRRLWEFLAEDHPEHGLDLSGSERFAFSVDDAVSVSNAGSAVSRRSLLLSKLKHGLIKHKEKSLFPWKFGFEESKEKSDLDLENKVEERNNKNGGGRKRKVGPVDHNLVLGAISRALDMTEVAYLDMTNQVIDRYPELALMGSCLLVVLMRDEDVYVMNVGDSRAIVAQYESQEDGSCREGNEVGDTSKSTTEGIVEESKDGMGRENQMGNEVPAADRKLSALQLSTDHSTSIEEEVTRIKNEHPDDRHCIVNDRVKGRLKVTRAFGAGSLKQPKLNDALLEMFRNEYIGTTPYISCTPSLRYHKLYPRDQFLVLSSDGLYQYLTNQEVVSYVENFIEKFPDGDPAQHLIEELLLRAAKKAGMDLHELLDIPQGDRRKYHDDVTVMVISLEGRIWKSSGKYL